MNNENTDEKYICPITNDYMVNPVLACDGHIYEKDAIKCWLKIDGTSPMTREKIKNVFVEQIQLRVEIQEYCKDNNISLDKIDPVYYQRINHNHQRDSSGNLLTTCNNCRQQLIIDSRSPAIFFRCPKCGQTIRLLNLTEQQYHLRSNNECTIM